MSTFTNLLRLVLPAFGSNSWDVPINGNFRMLDALLGAFVNVTDFMGPWTNDTAYTAGKKVIDGTTGQAYQCLVDHTSHASNSFSVDRTNNPTYWQTYSLLLAASVGLQLYDRRTLSASTSEAFTLRPGMVEFIIGTGIHFSVDAEPIITLSGGNVSYAVNGLVAGDRTASNQTTGVIQASDADATVSDLNFVMAVFNALDTSAYTQAMGVAAYLNPTPAIELAHGTIIRTAGSQDSVLTITPSAGNMASGTLYHGGIPA